MARMFFLAAFMAGVPFSQATAADAKPPAQRGQPPFLQDTPEQFIKRFDKNKDGFLSKDELPPFLARLFDRFDANRDGKLDKQEVAALQQFVKQRLAQQTSRGPTEAAVTRFVDNLLLRMDKDKDGKISRQEATGNVATNFDRLDRNKDGFLDRAELTTMARRFLANRQRQGFQGGGLRSPEGQNDFDALDLNADGRLTREELKGTRFLKVFDDIDTNKDGKIERKEFEAYLKKTAK